ncbi:MAG: hypothetical protein RQ732_09340 [Methylophaga sp.]|nr:hypothetical protein [Methylophaga sp.]
MKSLMLLSLLVIPLVQAEPVEDEANIENYQQCMFSESVQKKLENSDEPMSSYCTIRYFDTAPTAFQANVLLKNLDDMKARDPKFKAFYDKLRDSGSNNIYTDRQIVLMYIDKREVNKD